MPTNNLCPQSSLTQRQEEILHFIGEWTEQHGFPPTVREIGLAFAISSPNGVICHLKALYKKGRIALNQGKARGITVLNRAQTPWKRLCVAIRQHQEARQGGCDAADEALYDFVYSLMDETSPGSPTVVSEHLGV
jgi:SOS-response transcriptional repressor LexA